MTTFFWPVYDPSTGSSILELPDGEIPQGSYHGGPYTSYGPRYETLDALHASCGMKDRCVECGDLINTSFMEPTRSKMIADRLCFTCNFWRARENTKEALVVIDGHAYEIGDEKHGGQEHSGFAGRRFDIEFSDGRRVTTRNLWSRGAVPKHFADRLPNNARFVNGEAWVSVGPTRVLG